MRRLGTVALMGAAMALASPACTKRVDPPPTEGLPTLNLAKDAAAIDGSWLIRVAKNPDQLVQLAGSNDGWRGIFTGHPGQALTAFLDADAGNRDAQIGGARAALELATAHARLADLVRASTPRLLAAQSTRPTAAATASWRAYMQVRLAQATGGDVKKALAAVGKEADLAPWLAAASGGEGDLAKLLAGDVSAVDTKLPPGGTKAFGARLAVIALAKAGRAKEARARWKRLDHKAPDYEVGTGDGGVTFLDPVAAGAGAMAYAATALKLLDGAEGWPGLLRADALVLLGRHTAAREVLAALDAAPPTEIDFAQVVVTAHLSADDVRDTATALRIRLLAKGGDQATAQNLYAKLGNDTVGQRVNRAWAGAFLGHAPEGAFPDDRDVVFKLVSARLVALGKEAAGMADVTELALGERWVDALQRRYAEALAQADRPEVAGKNRDAAEEKRVAFAPSGRNTLTALTSSALNNAKIGRSRVSLKYLSRMESRLPAAAGPAEILRDLLSHRALQESGGPAGGQ